MLDNQYADVPWWIWLAGLAVFFVGIHIWAYIRCPGHRFFDW